MRPLRLIDGHWLPSLSPPRILNFGHNKLKHSAGLSTSISWHLMLKSQFLVLRKVTMFGNEHLSEWLHVTGVLIRRGGVGTDRWSCECQIGKDKERGLRGHRRALILDWWRRQCLVEDPRLVFSYHSPSKQVKPAALLEGCLASVWHSKERLCWEIAQEGVFMPGRIQNPCQHDTGWEKKTNRLQRLSQHLDSIALPWRPKFLYGKKMSPLSSNTVGFYNLKIKTVCRFSLGFPCLSLLCSLIDEIRGLLQQSACSSCFGDMSVWNWLWEADRNLPKEKRRTSLLSREGSDSPISPNRVTKRRDGLCKAAVAMKKRIWASSARLENHQPCPTVVGSA